MIPLYNRKKVRLSFSDIHQKDLETERFYKGLSF